ncbi:Carbamoyl-phosphate synthase [Mycena kentingensis (nom. inval.)]|nr:Carbamoyl-phosphate synthase [Mycena kentingensis (nom. inval.)]
MEDRFADFRDAIQDALDDVASPRSSSATTTEALKALERLLAASFVPTELAEDSKDYFLALQYTFECNVPSRLLPWISAATLQLETLHAQRSVEGDADAEVATISSQLGLSLSILQGVCLTHTASKAFLGRKYSLEVLLELFLASRHLSSPSASSSPVKSASATSAHAAPLPLASICQGVHAIVKILKRAATPREVRMKCLEFLYFYLLDETSPASEAVSVAEKPVPAAPSTPAQPSKSTKPSINATPVRPTSRYGSSTFSFTSSSFTSDDGSSSSSSAPSSRSTSGSSFSSTSSNAGSTSPKKRSQMLPTPATPRPHAQPRALMMLRKDLDFVPVSPQPRKKPIGIGDTPRRPDADSPLPPRPANATPMRARGIGLGHARTRSRLASGSSVSSEEESQPAPVLQERSSPRVSSSSSAETVRGPTEAKTTEEKKRLLSTMLGNVEALVDGVRKAGIWGLG